MELSDAISCIALVVSIICWARSASIEKRLRSQSDNRYTFDNWLTAPIEAHLAILAQIARKISNAARDNQEFELRSKALSDLQRSEFDQWYFEMEALCDSQSDVVLKNLKARLEQMLDDLLVLINELGEDLQVDDIREEARKITLLTQRFMSETRADLHSNRLKIR